MGMFALAGLVLALIVLSGCDLKHPVGNELAGKQLFLSKCGSCHTLAHANTSGTVGPNLDDAFRQDRADGYNTRSIQGLVDYWIQYPNSEGVMPAMLYSGQKAQDVAAYVAHVAAEPGKDTGRLASIGQATAVTAAAGKAVFTGPGGCGACHTLAAAGTTGTIGPNLSQRLVSDCSSAASKRIRGATLQKCILAAITDPYAYIPSGYRAGIMPSNFKHTLSSTDILALVKFISTSVK
jgi:mono/diheme cytochrome c family protein